MAHYAIKSYGHRHAKELKAEHVNIRHIGYFVAVADCGSLSAAAKDQCVTVQAVSKAIADLERELGQSLFVRESRGVRLTPFGGAFRQKAEEVLHSFDDLQAFAATYEENSHCGVLQLALCSPAFYRNEHARESIAMFIKRGLKMDATVALSSGGADGLDKLRTGECDGLITIGSWSHPDIDCVSIGTVTPGILMSENHPLAGKSTISLADIKDHPVATSHSMDTFNDSIVNVYRHRGIDVQFVELMSEREVDTFLESGGLIFVAGISVLGSLHPNAEMRPIVAEDAVPIPICLVSLKDRKSPAYRAFARWLKGELILFGTGSLESLER